MKAADVPFGTNGTYHKNPENKPQKGLNTTMEAPLKGFLE